MVVLTTMVIRTTNTNDNTYANEHRGHEQRGQQRRDNREREDSHAGTTNTGEQMGTTMTWGQRRCGDKDETPLAIT
jgi:hypothetical protein